MEVPLAVVTVTSTVPDALAGLMTTICVAVMLWMVAEKLPNFTAVAPARLGAGDRDRGAARRGTGGGTNGRHRRHLACRRIGELIGRRGGGGAVGRRHRHIDGARCADRAKNHDLRRRVALDGGDHAAKLHRGGAGQVGAGDRDRGAARRGTCRGTDRRHRGRGRRGRGLVSPDVGRSPETRG